MDSEKYQLKTTENKFISVLTKLTTILIKKKIDITSGYNSVIDYDYTPTSQSILKLTLSLDIENLTDLNIKINVGDANLLPAKFNEVTRNEFEYQFKVDTRRNNITKIFYAEVEGSKQHNITIQVQHSGDGNINVGSSLAIEEYSKILNKFIS